MIGQTGSPCPHPTLVFAQGAVTTGSLKKRFSGGVGSSTQPGASFARQSLAGGAVKPGAASSALAASAAALAQASAFKKPQFQRRAASTTMMYALDHETFSSSNLKPSISSLFSSVLAPTLVDGDAWQTLSV